ncbi:MAG TPA: hypothetical protein VMS08_03760 [Candidatus Saccharimonadia bacterium]|nr:hypothetical protein [Candidatus Saccharimonadia bacterium]
MDHDEDKRADDEQADSYYGEDDMEMGDLDLSFLDEDEDEEKTEPSKG